HPTPPIYTSFPTRRSSDLERILRGDFPEGTALPPERELVSQTRMSRTTVREALRILEVQGLVRIKTGRAGGAYVYRPGEESMAGDRKSTRLNSSHLVISYA